MLRKKLKYEMKTPKIEKQSIKKYHKLNNTKLFSA